MAKPKPKAKSSARTATSTKATPASNHPRMRLQIAGTILILGAIWVFLAVVMGVLREGDHPLGPYLGKYVAERTVWFLGIMPSLLGPVALALAGARLVVGAHPVVQRVHWGGWLLWAHLLLFLAIPGLGSADLTFAYLSRHGGALGQFLMESLFQPIFGTHMLGPVLVLVATLGATLFFLFRYTPRQALVAGAVKSKSVWERLVIWARERRANAAVAPVAAGPVASSDRPVPRAVERRAERGLVAGGALAMSVEPRGRFMDRQVRPEPDTGVLPLADSAKNAPRPRAGRTPLVPGAVLSGAATAGAEETPAALAGKALEVYNGLSKWRPLRPEDLVGLDPLEIRELKRRDEEIRRAFMLNEWEDREVQAQVSRRPRIAPEPSPAVPERSETISAQSPAQDPLPEEDHPLPGESPGLREEASAVAPPRIRMPAPPREPKVSVRQTTEQASSRYRIPEVSILPDPPSHEAEFDESELQATAERLVTQLRNFNVQGKVLQIEPGPVITRFKVELAPGTPVRKISNLSEDLALALRAKRIRIQAPIPGEALVGIEIPNLHPETVHIKELLRSPQFRDPKMKLPVVLGKDTAGHPAFTDLARAPHLLIAGQTGSGKSVCINTILSSFLFSQSPERLRMILIDPKVVELSTYAEIPHLMCPVITKPEEAVQALKWTAVEMDRRYDVLAAAGVRNIAGFNDKFEAGSLPAGLAEEDAGRMPYLLLIVDEFADLMMVAGKEVETNVARIAQKARAVGIHMILATQRPSTNVITGVIKANLPTRIAFQVASQIDARTILDKQGAEDLLGRGDMLFRGIEAPEPTRIHGAYVTDGDAEAAALAASSQGVVFPMIEKFDLGEEDGDGEASEAPVKFDAKFGEAARMVALTRQGSVSMLQRRLEIGFARAGRLMDQLERMGIVGRDRGSKAREVLLDELQVEDLVRRLEEGP